VRLFGAYPPGNVLVVGCADRLLHEVPLPEGWALNKRTPSRAAEPLAGRCCPSHSRSGPPSRARSHARLPARPAARSGPLHRC